MSDRSTFVDDWELLRTFLPKGWDQKARELGAIKRQPRKVQSIADTLRILLIHLAEGCSLRETVVRAEEGGLPRISDVALLKRLRASSDWFLWMGRGLLERHGTRLSKPDWLAPYRVRSVDASIISEPGSTGTDWRLHFALELFSLRCDTFLITRPQKGESFTNFSVAPGDLLIGDRAYGSLKGMQWIRNHHGEFLIRLKNRAFQFRDSEGKLLDVPSALKSLKVGELWECSVTCGGALKDPLKARLCALRKSDREAEKSQKAYRKTQSKKQRKIDKETLEMHRYVLLITSLPREIETFKLFELYRFRWQIELAFKRLKSILGLGHLPKTDEESCRAWLHGKLLVALLNQAILDEGRHFSPWGYPLQP